MRFRLGKVYNRSAKAGRMTPKLLSETLAAVGAWRVALGRGDHNEEVRTRETFLALSACLRRGRHYHDQAGCLIDTLPLGRPRLEDALWHLWQVVTCRPGATDRETRDALDGVLREAETPTPPADAITSLDAPAAPLPLGLDQAGTGQDEGGSTADGQLEHSPIPESATPRPPLPPGPSLDDEDVGILKVLKDRQLLLMTAAQIAGASHVSERTVRDRLNRLIDLGLASRPRGKKRGATITAAGIAVLEGLPKADAALR
jgi:hypothetical protein